MAFITAKLEDYEPLCINNHGINGKGLGIVNLWICKCSQLSDVTVKLGSNETQKHCKCDEDKVNAERVKKKLFKIKEEATSNKPIVP